MRRLIFISFLLFFFAVAVPAATAQQPDAMAIVKRANHMALYQGQDMKTHVHLTITDRQGRIRERKMIMLRKNDDTKDGGQKYFTSFLAPADVRKMVFMVHKHETPKEADDRWLYLPGLDLVKRIAAGDKRTSFVGSDFLYEDVSGRNIMEDTHKCMAHTPEYHQIHSTPKVPEDVEFDHYISKIDTKTGLPLVIDFFRNGTCYRSIETRVIKEIDAGNQNGETYPTVMESVATNHQTGSVTRMQITSVSYNTGIRDRLFSERFLRRPPREALR